jgi:hypothetical protein
VVEGSAPEGRTSENSVQEKFTPKAPIPAVRLARSRRAVRRYPLGIMRKWRKSRSFYGPGEAVGDAVGEGDGVGEGVGDAVRPVVAGPVVEGTGVVVVGAVRSGVCAGGSYGPDSAMDNAVATTTAASTHAGASTTARGTRCVGCTRPPRAYHKSAANTTSTATNSHQGYPRMNGLPRSPNRSMARAPR